MGKKNNDEEIVGYPVAKRVRTYNPNDKRKSNVKKLSSDETSGKKGISSTVLALIWSFIGVAAIVCIIVFKGKDILDFITNTINRVFSVTYAWVGWGIVVVLCAVLIAIIIVNRKPIYGFLLNKLKINLWHYWIAGVILVFAVWGILGLFDLGGKIGFYIVGEYLVINYLRVAALFILAFIIGFPALSFRAIKSVWKKFIGLFKPMDESQRKPRKKKKSEEIIEMLDDNANSSYGYSTQSTQSISSYTSTNTPSQSLYGFARPSETPANSTNLNTTTEYANVRPNQPIITGSAAVNKEQTKFEPPIKKNYSNLSGYVDPRKYQDGNAPKKTSKPDIGSSYKAPSAPTPAYSSKYGVYGYVNTQQATSPSRSDKQPEQKSVRYDDYSFKNNVTVISPNTPDVESKKSVGSSIKGGSGILRFEDVQPYVTESPIPYTSSKDKNTTNSSNTSFASSNKTMEHIPTDNVPPKPSYSSSMSSNVKKSDNDFSPFLPFDLDLGKIDDNKKKDVTEGTNPYVVEEIGPYDHKAELKAEIEANKNSVPYVPVQNNNIESQAKNWRPDMNAIPYQEDGWKLPETDLLIEANETNVDELEHQHTADMIEEALASYGVDARVVAINPGPAVTQFGVEPGFEYKIKKVKTFDEEGNPIVVEEKIPGNRVRVDKIKGLADDLKLALQAPSIRVEAPVPNQSYVGIEIPNKTSFAVPLRSIIESEPFKKLESKSKLTIALGKGTGGEEICADIAKMPHVLIAGATGSGKSVCLNTLIASLIMNNTPTELKMIMIDPKRVEMTQYASLPHLLTPVIVEPDVAISAMRWLQAEMDNRLHILQQAKARNIEAYNVNRVGLERMPNIVLIVDELADLMMTGFNEAETILCRIAQLARAVGIHLVVATQRPSVNVITGLIKANFPTRISFATTSVVDSRTILDMGGAENLLGKGDMLYAPPGIQPLRLQGCFVSDTEIERLVYFWGQQNGPNTPMIDLTTVPIEQTGAAAKNNPTEDVLMPEVRKLGQTTTITTSLLQRKLGIGYPRAARLSDKYKEELAMMGDGGAEIPEDDYDFD